MGRVLIRSLERAICSAIPVTDEVNRAARVIARALRDMEPPAPPSVVEKAISRFGAGSALTPGAVISTTQYATRFEAWISDAIVTSAAVREALVPVKCSGGPVVAADIAPAFRDALADELEDMRRDAEAKGTLLGVIRMADERYRTAEEIRSPPRVGFLGTVVGAAAIAATGSGVLVDLGTHSAALGAPGAAAAAIITAGATSVIVLRARLRPEAPEALAPFDLAYEWVADVIVRSLNRRTPMGREEQEQLFGKLIVAMLAALQCSEAELYGKLECAGHEFADYARDPNPFGGWATFVSTDALTELVRLLQEVSAS